MVRYRLALDLGTNSIGWCAYHLGEQGERTSPQGILDMGVRIFSDGRHPKTGASNAVKRRMARGARRNRDRFIKRRQDLLDALVATGLMPVDDKNRQKLTTLDPYTLRARGLDERLETFELGRALFHLNQRRGFKSNRKSEVKDKNEASALKTAIKTQRDTMEELGARTFGEFLYLRRAQGLTVRSRMQTRLVETPKGKKDKQEKFYDFYPARQELEAEFNALWEHQTQYHPGILTEDARDRIYHCIFYQRPLKPQVVGKCTFERDEDRLPKAYPLAHQVRIYQELNHLQVLDTQTLRGRPLTHDERDDIAKLLCTPNGRASGKAEVSFNKIRDKFFGPHATFSLESETRKSLEGDSTTAILSHKTRFGRRWYDLSNDQQENIVALLLNEDDEELLLQILEEDWGLSRAQAEAVATAPLPDGHGRLGRTALTRILTELKADVIPFSEAVTRAGYVSHSQFNSGQARERLPYYGEILEREVIPDPEHYLHPAAKLEQRFGKLTNPTVHIALNQLRRVVNDIIKLHGKPVEIHVEVLRDLKNSLKKKKEIAAEQAKNKEQNDRRARELREKYNETVNRENIQRLRLWEEMPAGDRICVYTGESICPRNLFTSAVEIDHILPISRTLDDSMANKVLCVRHANREKSNQTPFEVWGKGPHWDGILARSSVLPRNKRWRFAEDAMKRFEEEHDFIARQLTDSQYIAKLARGYLACLYAPDKAHKVLCIPGRLTGMFRHHLGLSSLLEEVNPALGERPVPNGEKNRADHRHHTVDALVVGLMDRVFLQKAASICARHELDGVGKFLEGFSEPWPSFRADARTALANVVVSHKLDHGIEGELHNQTAYGIAQVPTPNSSRQPDPRGQAVHRISVQDFKPKNILEIRGRRLRAELVAFLSGEDFKKVFKLLAQHDDSNKTTSLDVNQLIDPTSSGESFVADRIRSFLTRRNIRRVRIIERMELIPIRDKQKKIYKGFKPDGNAYLDIHESEDATGWKGTMVTRYAANAERNNDARRVEDRNGKHIMRLFNRDMVEFEHRGERQIYFVQRLSDSQFTFAEHFEANTDGRNRDKSDPFKFIYKGGAEALRKSKVRFLVVSPAGRVRYLSGIAYDSESD